MTFPNRKVTKELSAHNGAISQRRLALLNGIQRGEQAYADCQTKTHEEAKEKMAKWLKKSDVI